MQRHIESKNSKAGTCFTGARLSPTAVSSLPLSDELDVEAGARASVFERLAVGFNTVCTIIAGVSKKHMKERDVESKSA